jgi:hypothetical protein
VEIEKDMWRIRQHDQESEEEIDLGKKKRVVMKLGTHLLCKQIPAEGDAAFQRNRGKIGALAALDFRPRQQRRDDFSNRGA